MTILLLKQAGMVITPLLDVLESDSYRVQLVTSIQEAGGPDAASGSDLILLALPGEEMLAAAKLIRGAGRASNAMIVGVVEDTSTGTEWLDDPELLRTLDDCLVLESSPRILKRRLRFLTERATLRREHEATVSKRNAELERINAELTEAIEEQWEAQSALRENEAIVRAIVETTVDGIITIDTRGQIETFNSAAEAIFGYAAEEVRGKNISLLMPENVGRHHDGYIDAYMRTGDAKIIGIGREVLGKRKNGEHFPLELSISKLTIGGRTLFTGVVRDITERRRLEREILRAGDQERQRIGHDLHDGLGQALTGISLISRNLANRTRSENAAMAAEIDDVTSMVQEADQLARVIARNLVPVDVESNGLSYALQRLADNAERLFDISAELRDPTGALVRDNSVGTHLYRIAQEALSNAVRHGQATHVAIELMQDSSGTRLIVTDNGSGIPDQGDRIPSGMGLRIMHYRARIIRAELSISAHPDGGTEVQCRIPSEESNQKDTAS